MNLLRHMPILALASLVAFSASAGIGPASYDQKRISKIKTGIFCLGKPDRVDQAPGTARGDIHVSTTTPDLVQETRRIPAFTGIAFGFLVKSKIDTDATVRVVHPPLRQQRIKREEWETSLQSTKRTFHAYELDLGDGDPTGLWTFTITTMTGPVIEGSFEVYKPGRNETNPCQAAMSS
jgi:Domain of unknown function (DUF3859)